MLTMLTVFNCWVFPKTRRLVQVFPEPVEKVWNNWELRVLVLVSLTLQLFLLHLGSRRRYSVKTRFKIILWFFYLSADSVATVALGVISNNQGNSCNCKGSQLQNELTAFWAPFLLLHLGGQDTITAYAVQDNELWSRNLLGLVVQSVMALYVFLLSWKVNWLSFLTILMLLAGFIKYAERIWVMRLANCGPSTPSSRKPVAEPTIEEEALGLFKYFIDLFRNQKVIHARALSGHFDSTFHGWKVIEVELGYAYDAYYTKAPLFFTAWGFIFRFLSFTSIFSVSVLFHLKERQNHSLIDVIITYLLLAGAIFIEVYAAILLSASDWPWPEYEGLMELLQTKFAPIRKHCAKLITSNQRWSNSIGQLNLLSFALKDKSDQVGRGTPKLFANMRDWVFNQILSKLDRELEMLLYSNHKQVSPQLKDLVYNMFLEKLSSLSSNTNKFSLEYGNYFPMGIGNVEIYERIMIWHIATDLCFYTDGGANDPTNKLRREVSKDVSDYMMYIIVIYPFVLSTGNAIVSFENTCAKVEEKFQAKKLLTPRTANACAMLISEFENPPTKNLLLADSPLPFAFQVARTLNQMDEKWEILSKFWVENLAYVATLCQGNNHAQLLSKGGEFLTHVWFLLEHFDLTESFKKS